MQEPRSHIEGATPATAIWSFGDRARPVLAGNRPVILDRRIPVDDFLRAGTIEGLLNRRLELQAQIAAAERTQAAGAGRDAASRPSSTRPQSRGARADQGAYDKLKAEADALGSRPTTAEAGRAGRPRPTTSAAGRRAALAADPARDDLQRLPDDQGPGRRAGLRRDAR